MKIKINREIEVPDKMICHSGRCDCPALEQIENKSGYEKYAHCKNFNGVVFWSDKAGFYVKNRACIDATLDFFHGNVK